MISCTASGIAPEEPDEDVAAAAAVANSVEGSGASSRRHAIMKNASPASPIPMFCATDGTSFQMIHDIKNGITTDTRITPIASDMPATSVATDST